MLKTTTILLVTLAVLAGLTTGATATSPIGPFCLSTSPFTDTLAWFVDNTAMGNQFIATGRNLSNNRAQTVSIFLSGSTAHFVYTTGAEAASEFPVIAGGTINLNTLTGSAVCYRVASTGGCGAGSTFNVAPVTCPAGASSDVAPDAKSHFNPQ